MKNVDCEFQFHLTGYLIQVYKWWSQRLPVGKEEASKGTPSVPVMSHILLFWASTTSCSQTMQASWSPAEWSNSFTWHQEDQSCLIYVHLMKVLTFSNMNYFQGTNRSNCRTRSKPKYRINRHDFSPAPSKPRDQRVSSHSQSVVLEVGIWCSDRCLCIISQWRKISQLELNGMEKVSCH